MKKKRKIWIPILAVVLIAAIAAAAVFVWRGRNSKVVDVYPVSNLYDTYWGDTSTLDGNVSSGKVQTVPMREGLIQSINVSEGDTVSPGDVLMVYDTTSFQLTLQSDQARIGLLESNIELANRTLATYKGLKPSEDAPLPTEEIIDHGPLNIRDVIDAADCTGSDLVFQCSGETVVTTAFLQQLRASGAVAEFQLYEDNILYGSWFLDGSDESLQPYTVEFDTDVTVSVPGSTSPAEPDPVPDSPEEPDTDDPGVSDEDAADPSEPDAAATPDEGAASEPPSTGTASSPTEVTQRVTVSKTFDPIQDWTLGDGLMFTGDGVSLSLGASYTHFGELVSCSPMEYEQFETVYHDNYVPDGSDNYLYSKAELAEMIKQTEQEIASLQLDLKSAQLTYQQDQLVSQTGEITAAIAGTVTELKDAAAIATGETLITVKGTESYTVTAYISEMNLAKVAIGDTLSVYTYESGNSVTATISEIDTTPASGYNYGWNENPNNSYYPITATVDDPDAELTIGEWCEITLMTDGSEGGGIYLPLMYVRKDDSGSYVMLAGEDGRLKKQYVSTGKTLWGYEIEIKGGITLEDRIAFPYGKTVKEGALTQDLDYPW